MTETPQASPATVYQLTDSEAYALEDIGLFIEREAFTRLPEEQQRYLCERADREIVRKRINELHALGINVKRML